MILVSACLLGANCKYNGENNLNYKLKELLEGEKIITVCPERFAGLSIPRPPSEIQGGDGRDVLEGRAKVRDKFEKDITEEFIKGAQKSLDLAEHKGCNLAILKARSPSCGSKQIYDGSFSGDKKEGVGVTTALLESKGIRVLNEEDIDEIRELIAYKEEDKK